MRQGYHTRWAAVTVVTGLTALTLTLGGCGQQDNSPSVPAPSAPAATPAVIHQSEQPQSKAAHQSILDAQSAYWRKHGQGLNEAKADAKPVVHKP